MAYSYSVFGNMLASLERMGIMDILLPFILVFTLVFAVLQKTKIMGADKKNFNVIIALVLALAVVIPHATNSYPPGGDVVDIINASLPHVALVMIIGLGVMILIGLWGVSPQWAGPLTGIIVIASFVIILMIFGGAADIVQIPDFLRFLDDPETQALIVVLLVFGLIVKVITSDGEKTKGESFMDSIGKFFGKGP